MAAGSSAERLGALLPLARTAPVRVASTALLAVRRRASFNRSSERALPLLVAALVAIASLVSFQPAAASPTGSTSGSGSTTRLAIGGPAAPGSIMDGPVGDTSQGVAGPRSGPLAADATAGFEADVMDAAGSSAATVGPIAEDGTLYKAFAPNTTVADGKALLTNYTVRPGDTLTGLASRFGVSMMTIWWANSLTSKDALHVGQTLVIPPVSGLIVTVKEGDTIEGLAAKYSIDPSSIIEVNQLDDPNLVIGQILVLPGAAGAAIPTPTPRPVVRSSSGSSSAGVGSKYTGGKLLWPVVGGNNYISQYYHYGHYAIDIAATYGSPVRAAAAGTVLFAGWKNNGGGWQVWIAHGGNFYTTYNHMSALSVATGQSVARGQRVGSIGQSGDATGPHCHFETWIGPIWNGGTRVNPLRYF